MKNKTFNDLFIRDCPRCNGTGKIKYIQGHCKNGERCQFTNPIGKRLDYCFKCHRKKYIPKYLETKI